MDFLWVLYKPIKHGDKLDEAVETLRSYLESVLDDFKGGDLDFAGVNDNFPGMSTYAALFGGGHI